MNIKINASALVSSHDDLLWKGALYGLKRLQELNHALFFNTQELTEKQQVLLDQEAISATEFPDDKADAKVMASGDMLQFKSGDKILEEAPDWIELSDRICFPSRKAAHKRKTAETEIEISLNIDGSGKSKIDTGLGFFDHMLEQIARHGLVDMQLKCDGDLQVDEHHTIEDVAIALGETIKKALGKKVGIQRYSFVLAMDESQSRVALDLSGRPYLNFEGTFRREKVGDFPTEMVEHFFYSLAISSKATLHMQVRGENDHHKIEACFKGFARCLRASVSRSERNLNILPSTKDVL